MATASFNKDFSISEVKDADELIDNLDSAWFGVEYDEVDQNVNKGNEEFLLAKLASA